MLLNNGTIYTAWASFCDYPPYSGWIIAYNEQTLAQTAIFNSDPNGVPTSSDLPDGSGSGIWQAGSPIGVDATGNLYAATGNGPFDTSLTSEFPANGDYGDTFLKLTPSLQVTDYFTPDTQLTLAENDGDFNSGGHLILDIADSSNVIHHLIVTAGKDTNIYVLNRDNLGKYNSGINNIYQEVDGVFPEGVWSSPAYFNRSIYYGAFMDSLFQFQFTGNAMLNPVPVSATTTQFTSYGDTPSISSNGNTNGIVWIQESLPSQVVLHAYDATDVGIQLYSSAAVSFGAPTKFAPPTVCNGKVFVGTMNSVGVFGLLHSPSSPGSDQVASSFVSYSGDFNGDGKQDILWRDTETGEVDIWFMNGPSVTAKAKVGTIGSEWKIVGIADFNGDGKSDILWQNTLNGTFGVWIMNGASYVGQGFNSQGPQWSIAGVADIDHTGFADIFWRNVVTEELVAWKSGSGLTFNSFHIGTAGLDWNLAGVANLFDSNESALIWQNQNSGEVVAWQLSGNAISAQSSLGVVPLNWTVAGFGDFNGDGHQDILWHNSSDGTVVAWMMNGFQVSAKWINQNFIAQNWQIRATPNVVGNGPNSILWSDSQTGEQVIWISSGSGFSQTSIGFAPPPWTVLR